MIAGYLDFTPKTLGYNGTVQKKEMVDIPLSFGGISYRCTCAEFLGNVYCVMPFRKVNGALAVNMAEKVERAHYFDKPIHTVIAQIIDRHNMIIEYCQSSAYIGNDINYMETACVSAGAMCKMGYIEKDVWVEHQGIKIKTTTDSRWGVSC